MPRRLDPHTREHGARAPRARLRTIVPTLALLLTALVPAPVFGQQEPADGAPVESQDAPVESQDAPPEAYVPPEPVRLGAYTTTGTVELGWRFTGLDGSQNAYRSIVDLPEGLSLAFSRIEFRSPENEGFAFDHLLVEGSGWGEPSSTGRVRAAKRGLYIADYRRSRIETYNFLPDFANPLFDDGVLLAPHGWDRSRELDAIDLTLFPERRVEGRLAYLRTQQSGLGLGTDISSDTLVFSRDLDNTAHEVRGGVALRWPKWFLSIEQGTRIYRDEERDVADPFTVTDPETLARFIRRRTTDGRAPTTRGVLTASPLRNLKVTARSVYTDYRITGRLDETNDSVGSDLSSSLVDGRVEGHAFLFDSTQSYRLWDRVRVLNHVRYRRYRTVGETAGIFPIADNLANALRETGDRSLRDARLSDEVQVEVDPWRGATLRAGYRFARRIFDQQRTDALLVPPPFERFSTARALSRSDEQRLDVFSAGASYRLRHDVRFFVDFENGREPGPSFGFDREGTFYDRAGDFQRLRARGAFRPWTWVEVSGSVRATDRTFQSGVTPGRDVVVDDPENPVFVRLFDGAPPLQFTRSRAAGLTLRFTPCPRFQAGVTYDHVRNTASLDLVDLVETVRPDGSTAFTEVFRASRYADDEELVTADLLVEPFERLTVTAFYSLVNTAGSLPLHYHQAQVRGLYRIGNGVSGVVEWRLYDYDDHRYTVTDFRANHATVGVRWEW